MQENINIPDSNITTNLTFRNLVLMNMQQLTNFPYIENNFDALTDYELLCLVVKYLNHVITNSNEQNTSITNLYNSFLALQEYVNNTKDSLEDAFNELDEYVNNYFNNLDVQEEINNKLDNMAEDGTLTNLIGAYVDPIYQAYETTINNRVNAQDDEILAFKAVVNEKLTEQDEDISVLDTRMDTFSTLTEGSTTGDAELADIRVGFNGISYASAGDSVRAQANEVNKLETNLFPVVYTSNLLSDIQWTANYRVSTTGVFEYANGYKRSNLITINSKYLAINYKYEFESVLTYPIINFYSAASVNANNFLGAYNPSTAVASTVCSSNLDIIEVPDGAINMVISVKAANLSYISIYGISLNTNIINNGTIDYDKLKDIDYNKNVLTNTFVAGSISTSGELTESTTYKICDEVAVLPNTKYYRKNSDSIALVGCYDKNHDWIIRNQINENVDEYTTPGNCYYIRYVDTNANVVNQILSKYKVDYLPFNTTELYIKDSELVKAIEEDINILNEKRVCILGDSIAYGIGATDRTTDSWVALLQAKANCLIDNLAISGASIQYRANAESEAKSVYTVSTETDFTPYDYVIISAGTNDILANIGTPNDNVNTTACGALNLIIENILTSNPYCQIIFFGPMFRARFSAGDGHNSDEYDYNGKWVIDLADKLQETAEKNHIPNKNLYRTFELNKYNASILLDDGLHPNDLGHKRLYETINDFINSSL